MSPYKREKSINDLILPKLTEEEEFKFTQKELNSPDRFMSTLEKRVSVFAKIAENKNNKEIQKIN